MNKQERVAYLVGISTLITGQFKSPHNPSQDLADEFNKHWDLLKEQIAKEKEDEARTKHVKSDRQTFDDGRSDKPSGSEPDRPSAEPRNPPYPRM